MPSHYLQTIKCTFHNRYYLARLMQRPCKHLKYPTSSVLIFHWNAILHMFWARGTPWGGTSATVSESQLQLIISRTIAPALRLHPPCMGGIARETLLKMCHIYKIVHGFVDFHNAPLLYKPCTNYFTRYAHPLTLLQPQTRTNSYYFPFSHMLYQFFVVSSPNISMFKKSNLSL